MKVETDETGRVWLDLHDEHDTAELQPAEAEALALQLHAAAAEARRLARRPPAHMDCPRCPQCGGAYGKPRTDYARGAVACLMCGGCGHVWTGTDADYDQAAAAEKAWDAIRGVPLGEE